MWLPWCDHNERSLWWQFAIRSYYANHGTNKLNKSRSPPILGSSRYASNIPAEPHHCPWFANWRHFDCASNFQGRSSTGIAHIHQSPFDECRLDDDFRLHSSYPVGLNWNQVKRFTWLIRAEICALSSQVWMGRKAVTKWWTFFQHLNCGVCDRSLWDW